jgi:hypothetical protein
MMLSVVDGDLEFVDGQLVLVEGLEEIRQHVVIRLLLWRGELFYDLEDGVDYRDLVLPALERTSVLGELRRVILGTPGVLDATVILESETDTSLVLRGEILADLQELDDVIRAEFGPVTILGKT